MKSKEQILLEAFEQEHQKRLRRLNESIQRANNGDTYRHQPRVFLGYAQQYGMPVAYYV